MSLDRIVDEIIQDAMARGEFDNLPGRTMKFNLLQEQKQQAKRKARRAG
jgi:hypothetical protein